MDKRKIGPRGLEVSALSLGAMGYGDPCRPERHDRGDPRGGRRGRDLLRYRQGVRSVHQRGACRRGAGALPRQGRHRDEVRLGHRPRHRRAPRRREQPAGSDPARGRRVSLLPPEARPKTDRASVRHRVDPAVPMEEVAGVVGGSGYAQGKVALLSALRGGTAIDPPR